MSLKESSKAVQTWKYFSEIENLDTHYFFYSLMVLSGSMTSLSYIILDLLNNAHHNFDSLF